MHVRRISVATLTVLLLATAAGAGTLDQEVLQYSSNSAGFVGIVGRAQTFTAGVTGTIDRFDLLLSRGGFEDDLYVDLRTTSGGAPTESDSGSNVLASFTLDNADIPLVKTWIEFALPTGVAVATGDVFALVVRPETVVTDPLKNPGWGGDLFNNPYADGAMYNRGSSSWIGPSTSDMAFRTYVAASAVPLPSAAWGGLLLLLGAGAVRHHRARRRML